MPSPESSRSWTGASPAALPNLARLLKFKVLAREIQWLSARNYPFILNSHRLGGAVCRAAVPVACVRTRVAGQVGGPVVRRFARQRRIAMERGDWREGA